MKTSRSIRISGRVGNADPTETVAAEAVANVLANLLPQRRSRVCPRVVKRAISKHRAKGTIDRNNYQATIGINIVANFISPAFDFSNVSPQKISWRAGGMIAAVGSVILAGMGTSHAALYPLELRLINYAETDPESGLPFSSKALRECYRLGAEKFGWKDRKFEPRSMRDGRWLVGWGMATGVWGAFQMPATARITFSVDGKAHVTSAPSDTSGRSFGSIANAGGGPDAPWVRSLHHCPPRRRSTGAWARRYGSCEATSRPF